MNEEKEKFSEEKYQDWLQFSIFFLSIVGMLIMGLLAWLSYQNVINPDNPYALAMKSIISGLIPFCLGVTFIVTIVGFFWLLFIFLEGLNLYGRYWFRKTFMGEDENDRN